MKVILLKDVRNVGQRGTVHEVADGYARNYLFAHKMAEAATEERVAQIMAAEAARQAAAKKEAEQLDQKIASLSGKAVTIAARATEKGGLFKAVGAADVAKAIRAEHRLEIPPECITLNEAIKTVGEHQAALKSAGHKASLTVIVTPGL